MDILLAILSGSVGVALVTAVKELIMWRLNKRPTRDLPGKVDALMYAQTVSLRDKILHLSREAIRENRISLELHTTIINHHDAYKRLGGNGELNEIITLVKQIPITKELSNE